MTKSWMTVAGLCVALFATALGAEEKDQAPGRKTPTPIRVQVVLMKLQGEKKVVRLPYDLTCNADDDRKASLRMGIEVPVDVGGKGVQYRNVGTNIDCQAYVIGNGRFKVNLSVEQSSIYSMNSASRAQTGGLGVAPAEKGADPETGNPLFRTFNSFVSAILRDGQTAQLTAATDPVSGETVKIEVTLTAIK